MASRFKCGGCKGYFPMEQTIRQNGVQRFCSEECAYPKVTAPKPMTPNKPKKKKPGVSTEVREAVLKRDKNRCRFCGTKNGLHVHHVFYRSQGGEHVEHNLITVCYRHHDLIHSDKKRFQPLCLGVLWLSIVEARHMTIPRLERLLHAEEDRKTRYKAS